MLDVLKTTQLVLNQAKYITINTEVLERVINEISEKDLITTEADLSFYEWSLEELIQVTFIFNTINFCYWALPNEQKWQAVVDGETIKSGSVNLLRIIEKTVKENPKLLSGKLLANIDKKYLHSLVDGNVIIPLFKERLQFLNTTGKILLEKYNDNFLNVFEKSSYNAISLVSELISNFPTFDDTSSYKESPIGFYKRAQLSAKMISDILEKYGKPPLKDLDKLTAFADYKVPQILRTLGILNYSTELANIVDNNIVIQKDSEYEVEIRAVTIQSIENMKQQLANKYPLITSAHIDSYLWNKARENHRNEKPAHHTYTTAY